jgi:hypothetical protein
MSDDEVNQVDVSDATIDAEWSRIANDHDVDLSAGAGDLNFDGVEGVSVDVSGGSGVSLQTADDLMQSKIDMGKTVIKSALEFGLGAIFGLKIEADKYDKVAEAWSIVIAHRYEGGIFEIMAKYEKEINAVVCTAIFAVAIQKASIIKAEEKQKATIAANKAKAANNAASSEIDSETKGDDNNA